MKSYFKSQAQYFKDLVVGSDTRIPLENGSFVPAINFDNAATTPPLYSVMQEINNFSPWYSSIHRGTGYKSVLSSNIFEYSRDIIKEFVKADEDSTVIFVKNTTEAINKLSFRLLDSRRRNVILSTCMEHHSNDLPWRNKYKIDYVELNDDGRLSLENLEYKLRKYRGSVGLVAVTGASNVTGFKNPVHKIAAIAHRYKAKILVDGAQLIPHSSFDMKPADSPEHIDFLAFSSHKMYAPFGIGVLIGQKDIFEKGDPDYKGGGTVDMVTHDFIRWSNPPHKEEAGTPNVIGVVALIAAIRTLQSVGLDRIASKEDDLLKYTIQNLSNISSVEIFGGLDCNERLAIIPFNVEGMPHEMVATILSREGGIAVRNGCFCAQPYVQRLLKVCDRDVKSRVQDPTLPHPGLIRISFGLYNHEEEVDILIRLLKHIVTYKDGYINKYKYHLNS